MSDSYLVTIADQMCLIFGCELWPKAPGKFRNWTGKLVDSLYPTEWEPCYLSAAAFAWYDVIVYWTPT